MHTHHSHHNKVCCATSQHPNWSEAKRSMALSDQKGYTPLRALVEEDVEPQHLPFRPQPAPPEHRVYQHCPPYEKKVNLSSSSWQPNCNTAGNIVHYTGTVIYLFIEGLIAPSTTQSPLGFSQVQILHKSHNIKKSFNIHVYTHYTNVKHMYNIIRKFVPWVLLSGKLLSTWKTALE